MAAGGGGGGTNAGLGAGRVLGVALGGTRAGETSFTGGKGGLILMVIDLRGSSTTGAVGGAGVADALPFFLAFPFGIGSSLTFGKTPVAIFVFQA